MLLIAVINGAARDLWFKDYTGELLGRQISTITLLILFGIYIWFVIKKYPPQSGIQAIAIGMLWLMLTLAFEFGFGLFRGISLTQLFEEYNLLKGKIWILIPIWVAVTPYLFYKTNQLWK